MSIQFESCEVSAMARDPRALRAAADWHELQILQGEPCGFDMTININRKKELEAEALRLDAQHDAGLD